MTDAPMVEERASVRRSCERAMAALAAACRNGRSILAFRTIAPIYLAISRISNIYEKTLKSADRPVQ